MSGQQMAHWKVVAMSFRCFTCGVGPGFRCINRDNMPISEIHADRTHQASNNDWVPLEPR